MGLIRKYWFAHLMTEITAIAFTCYLVYMMGWNLESVITGTTVFVVGTIVFQAFVIFMSLMNEFIITHFLRNTRKHVR